MAQNPFSGKKKVIVKSVLVVGAIVLALGFGMWLRQMQGNDKASAPSSSTAKDGDTSTVDIPAVELSTETETASQLANSGKVDESNKYIAEQLAKPNINDTQKYDLYRQQALNAYNSGNYQVAFDAWVKADAIKQSATLSETIGDAAREMGKKSVAVEYYKKAVDQLDRDNNPLYSSDKGALESKIQSQGGSL